MLNLLSQFFNSIVAIIQFFINAILSLVNLFSKIPVYVSFLTTSINVLPVFIIPFALCAIAIYIVLFVVGR